MTPQKYNDFQYLVAYAVIIFVILLIIRTRVGYVTVYYSLSLFLGVLVLTHTNVLTELLKPISGTTS